MKKNNVFLHRDILTIDAGYSHENGTGYAIFDEQTHRLKTCGLIRPFAPGLESHASTIEIADKMKRKWEEEVGFSFDPTIMCIEHPIACFARQGVRVNSKSIITLAILCTRIEERFNAKTMLRPYPHTWKKHDTKEQTKSLVLNNLDAWSKRALERDLASVPTHLHHNIFDAVGMGVWAIQSDQTEKKKLEGTA